MPSQLFLHIGVRDVEVAMINFVTGACLIYGARTGDSGLILLWMVHCVIKYVLVNVFTLIFGTESIIGDNIADIVLCILDSALNAFLLLVVSSYREEIKKKTGWSSSRRGKRKRKRKFRERHFGKINCVGKYFE